MGLVAFAILVAVPGCLLTFGLGCDGLAWRHRLLVGIALSPAVVAAEMVLLKAAGASFGGAAWTVLLAGVLATLLVLRGSRFAPLDRGKAAGMVASFFFAAIVGALLWVSWHAWPSFPYFSWHSLHHTDLCYAVTQPGVIPEDPNMAGYETKYPFFAHYFWAVVSWFLDTAPNVTYQATNLVGLVVTALLTYEAACLLGCRPAAAVAAVVLLFAGNSLLAVVAEGARPWILRIVANDPTSAVGSLGLARIYGPWRPYLGDVRALSYPQKFFSMNIMPLALPLVSALLLIGGYLVGGRRGRAWNALLAAVLLGIGLLYPILLPPVFAIAGLIVAVSAIAARTSGTALRGFIESTLWVGGAAVAVASIWGYLLAGREGQALQAPSLKGLTLKAIQMLVAFGPLSLFCLPMAFHRRSRLDPAVLLLAAAAAASLATYVVVPLYAGNEYKWVFIAGTAFAVLGGRAIDTYNLRWRSLVPIVLLVGLASIGFNRLRFDEMGTRHAVIYPFPDVDWKGFWVALKSPPADVAWLEAVVEKTPPETILVAPSSRISYYAFNRRSEFVALDTGNIGRVGYAHPMRVIIPGVHGLPKAVYQERRRQLMLLYDASDPAGFPSQMAALRAVGRPLAIRFDRPDAPFLQWLRDNRIGRPLLENEDGALWFVPVA